MVQGKVATACANLADSLPCSQVKSGQADYELGDYDGKNIVIL